jgi:hypothetical protein
VPPCADSSAAYRSRDQLDREVGPAAPLDHALHLEALKTDEAAKGILHPLLLLLRDP